MRKEIIAKFGPSEEGTIKQLIPLHEKAGVRDYLYHYQRLHYTCPAPFPGFTGLLEKLDAKGVKLAMVTGKGAESAKLSLGQFGLTKYFGVLETGSPDGPNKVNGIRSALTRLGVDTSESVYVGDAPSDVRYCKEIGIPICAAAWASTTDADDLRTLNPEWLFLSVEEFAEWIMKHV